MGVEGGPLALHGQGDQVPVQMEEGQGLLQGVGTPHSPPGRAVGAGGPVSPPRPLRWAPVSSLPPSHCWWLQWGHVRGALGRRRRAPACPHAQGWGPQHGGVCTAQPGQHSQGPWGAGGFRQLPGRLQRAPPPGIFSPWTSLGRGWEPQTVDIIVLSGFFSFGTWWSSGGCTEKGPREGTPLAPAFSAFAMANGSSRVVTAVFGVRGWAGPLAGPLGLVGILGSCRGSFQGVSLPARLREGPGGNRKHAGYRTNAVQAGVG